MNGFHLNKPIQNDGLFIDQISDQLLRELADSKGIISFNPEDNLEVSRRVQSWMVCWISGDRTQMIDLLELGGSLRLSLFRRDGEGLFFFVEIEDSSSGSVTIEINPVLEVGEYQEIEEIDAGLILQQIPRAELISLEGRTLKQGQTVESFHVECLNEWLAKQPKEIVTCEFAVTPINIPEMGPFLLVSWLLDEPHSIFDEWCEWVRSHIPTAFSDPLYSVSSRPTFPGVAISLNDATRYDQMAEFQWDSTDAENRIQARVTQQGTEAFGWYQPIHQYERASWGIYLHSTSLLDIGNVLRNRLASIRCPTPNRAFQIAVELVLSHEFFHAQKEAFAFGQEISTGSPLYLPYKKNVYQATSGSSDQLEEALANYVAMQRIEKLLSQFQEKQGWNDDCANCVLEFIHQLFDSSPPGYRDWKLGFEKETWRKFIAQLMTETIHPANPLPLESVFHSISQTAIHLPDAPIYFTTEIPLADHLFHTPDKREVERLLRMHGHEKDSKGGKGSHAKWQRRDGKCFILPGGRQLSGTVFKSLLTHMGWTKAEYLKNRQSL